MRTFHALAVSTLLAASCGMPIAVSDAGVDDAGVPFDAGFDAGAVDSGLPDAGTPDAGAGDAGLPDAGTLDAGAPDSGTPDAGPVDAGPPPDVSTPALPCTDAKTAIYTATSNGTEPLGARLACHFERTLDAATVSSETPSPPSSPSEVDLHLLAYRTTRRGNVAGVSTARVYLPRTPKPGPLPVVVVMHGSVGIADNCAPSTDANGLFSLALPWASRGYAVIAPDLAGLGNAGTQGYVDNHDTAMSTLDGIRALRALLRPGALDGRAILVGFSQGGGAVLAAQTLEGTYGSGGRITAVVAVAPQFFTRLNSFGYVNLLRNPTALTVAQGYTKPVIAALRQYGWYENTLGPGRGVEAFPADGGAQTVDALERRCLIDLGGWLPSNRTRVGELIDDTLRTTFLACVDGPTSSGCVAPGKTFYDGLVSDLMAGDAQGAPVMYLQGGFDTVMPIGEEAACNVPALRDAGVRLTYCGDALALHSNIYDRNVELVRTWGESMLLGQTPPSCNGSPPPPCAP